MANTVQIKPEDKRIKEEFERFLTEFKSESDRAAVILGAAKLDILLYQLLSKFLLPNTTGNDELLDGDSPLGTFSSKINLSYRLGLIDKLLSQALHLIRKIRNSFAHEISGTTLDSGGHRDRVRQLTLPLKDYKNYDNLRELFFEGKVDTSIDFRLVLCVCLLRLETAIDHVPQISPLGKDGCPLISEAWEKKEKPKEAK